VAVRGLICSRGVCTVLTRADRHGELRAGQERWIPMRHVICGWRTFQRTTSFGVDAATANEFLKILGAALCSVIWLRCSSRVAQWRRDAVTVALTMVPKASTQFECAASATLFSASLFQMAMCSPCEVSVAIRSTATSSVLLVMRTATAATHKCLASVGGSSGQAAS